MRILLINHYAGSPVHGMEFRPYYFGKEWINNGHEVTIVAASYSHVRFHQVEMKGLIRNENINGINYVWLKTNRYKNSGFFRILNIFSFILLLSFHKRKLINLIKPDCIIASSTYPFDILPARKMAKKAKAKLIFEVHDLWPLSPIELGGYSRWHPFIVLTGFVEKYAYKVADIVISILPKTKDYMISRGMQMNKYFYIPNCINTEEWTSKYPLPVQHKDLFRKLKTQNYKIVGYAGSHGLANALETLILAAENLGNENIAFILVGDGPLKKKLMIDAKDRDLNNLHFLPPVNKNQMPALLLEFDILYIGLQSMPLFRFGICPNKLLDYLMSGKPVIQAIKAGNDIVTEADCGITVEPENSEEVCKAILHLTDLPQEVLNLMGQKGKKYVLKNHHCKVLAEKFLEIIGNNKSDFNK